MDVKQSLRRVGLLWLLIIVSAALMAQSDPVEFPDTALRAAVLNALDIEGGPIDSEDLEAMTTLLAGSQGIEDLSGLEACINLQTLQLHFNRIVDLAPLSGLRQLTSITLNGNAIVDVSPLALITSLTSLAIHGNAIVDVIPISTLPLLSSLSIGNAITKIAPLADLPNLTRLLLYVLPSADLSPLQYLPNLELLLLSSGRTIERRAPLDCEILANHSQLTSLRLEGYDLVGFEDLAHSLPKLTELGLYYVGMEDLSVIEAFRSLVKLTLSGVIPSSEGASLPQLDIPPNVTTLSLENNGIEDVSSVAGFDFLTNLSVARNRITSIEGLRTMSRLIVLDLSFNPVTDLTPLRDLVALKSLSLQGVPFDRTEGSTANLVIHELLSRGVNVAY